ncbi:MAG: DUF1553 domain-containing protein [Pirellulaceae bacterium]|nr:DUF1553 domain-containing protein [Pirellulaceae bacterium]
MTTLPPVDPPNVDFQTQSQTQAQARGRWALSVCLVWIGCCVTSMVQAAEPDKPVDAQLNYERKIKPLLAARCIACHGVLNQSAGLRLDTGILAKKGGDSGQVIVANEPTKSPLIARVSSTDLDQRMPPEGEPLTPQQIAELTAWIEAGAHSPADELPEPDPREHWAFQQIQRPAVPNNPADAQGNSIGNSTGNSIGDSSARNAIDAFLARAHREHKLTPQVEANKHELIRRLYIDLIGLPPSLEELAQIEQDSQVDWYERLVNRLLDDPRHGERWARHWMDIWRYSDWWGLGDQLRNSQKHIWHWRDWIVQSLNKDKPYDEMVRLMLAGDDLAPTDPDKLRATGFLARNYFLFNRHQWMDETVEHVSKGFMGLTMNCAKCHDHKYDPITQTDYYRMRAFFEPYHVRLDMQPGEIDLARIGLPRSFESQADSPTYLFVRGQETQPDKSAVISPGVPEILALGELNIEPKTLPAEAWQPERQAFVQAAYVAAADRQIQTAQQALVKAQATLASVKAKAKTEAKAESSASAPSTGNTSPAPSNTTKASPLITPFHDRFEQLDDQHWKSYGGRWKHASGQLQQQLDGDSRSVLRYLKPVPENFEATVRFTILGGSQWRSVCLSFDANQADPTASANADDSEQIVYVSAVSGGSKVQGSFSRAGQWQYPQEATVPRAIELNREYTLRVQVRGNLINAHLNNELVLAWQSPLARRSGALQLVTFDAIAAFHEFKLTALDDAATLQPAGSNSAPADSVAVAEAELRAAELDVTIAQQDRQALEARLAAQRADWAIIDSRPAATTTATTEQPAVDKQVDKQAAKDQAGKEQGDAELTAAARAANERAVKAQRALELTKAQKKVVGLELSLMRAAADKRAAMEKELKAAREALGKAEELLAAEVKETDRYQPLVGARWTATRFFNSGKDDPEITFGPKSSGRRTALAKWLTDKRHPLTARVAANHLWTRHMGTALVATSFDFGRKNPSPMHRELLDWLAAELVDSGWSMKHMHRIMVTSAAYRRSSSLAGCEANLAIDADNQWLWRRTPVRIESQVVRDSILSLAGLLDETLGGPSVMSGDQATSKRRSLYFFHSNNERNLFLTTFDEAAVKECYLRDQSIVPQQALALTNSQLVLDSAKPIADRISGRLNASAAPLDDSAFIRQAFLSLLAIEPSPVELQASRAAIEQWRQVPDKQNRSEYELLIWSLLNHTDFVTLR